MSLALAGCASETEKPLGTPGYVAGFYGAVAADEPRAALVGRDVLSAGGTAADAAVATYFTMAVTLPASAGLGGGGMCLSYNAEANRIEAFDFMPRATAGGRSGVPSSVRGMALLHAREGRLRWEQVVGPSEALARIGVRVSRAYGLTLFDPAIAANLDPAARAIYLDAEGRPPAEGADLRQPDLSATLGRIRATGAGDFYQGQLARQIAAASVAAGGDITLDDLRARIPEPRPAILQPLGDSVVAFGPPPAWGGAIAADIFAQMRLLGFDKAELPQRPHLMAEAIRRAVAAQARRGNGEALPIGTDAFAQTLIATLDRSRPTPQAGLRLQPDTAPPGASFVAADRFGNSVSCAVTTGGFFGTGRLLPGTGFFAAPPPSPSGNVSLVPMLAVNTNSRKTFFAGASTGGSPAPAALIQVAVFAALERFDLEEAMFRPRLFVEGEHVFIEPDSEDSAQALQQRGHTLTPVPNMGRVNAIWCPTGIPSNPSVCDQRSDPRGAGLASGSR
ncbi:gamma-glutamyltransferase [Lacibacterium aquatile]|uniref:Gamma-glutamyltransferase n=1 Tax=Lacibacterium aquatile TaxID=1168082 RepID=A0ABW5DTL2_9PROT